VTSWCQSKECEAKVKEETKATIRCLPFDEKLNIVRETAPCMVCGGGSQNVRAIFAISY
jgi:prolyl-tRNA synthetase